MIEWATTIAFVMLGLAMAVAIGRILVGPTLADRILGLDLASTLGVGIIAVFAARSGLSLYLDVAIVLALIGFLGTASFARYLMVRQAE